MRIFFHLTLRHFLKSVGLNTLNILGLSLGMIAALVIIVYTDHEFHYDQFHAKSDAIYRMEAITNGDQWFSNLGMEHARELMSGAYPEVLSLLQLNTAPRAFFETGGRNLPRPMWLKPVLILLFLNSLILNCLKGVRKMC